MAEYSVALIIVLGLVLAAEFVNGWTDAPNAIATVVSTRVLKPRTAVIMAAILNMLGAMSGTAVAMTIGKDIVRPEAINLITVGAAMFGIIFWSTLAWYYGLPTSETHALVSGLAGAGIATAGPSVLLWAGWQKVLIGLAFSTILGFSVSWFIITIISRFFRSGTPGKTRKIFGRLQLISAAFMAFSHGSNDGQKFIGAFTLALVLGGVIHEFKVAWEIIIVCSVVMGIGTATGGWRIIKTMGMSMVKLETYQGFAAETGAASCIELASRLGIPISTTHTIGTSIMGVGASRRLSAVRWGVAREVVTAWALTFPVCGAISYIVAIFFQWLIS